LGKAILFVTEHEFWGFSIIIQYIVFTQPRAGREATAQAHFIRKISPQPSSRCLPELRQAQAPRNKRLNGAMFSAFKRTRNRVCNQRAWGDELDGSWGI